MPKVYVSNRLKGNKGEAKALLFFTENGFLVRSQHQNDFGVDMEVELTTTDGNGELVTNGKIAKVQVKHYEAQTDRFNLTASDREYFSGMENIPVFLMYITHQNNYSIAQIHNLTRGTIYLNNFAPLFTVSEDLSVSLNSLHLDELKEIVNDHYLHPKKELFMKNLRTSFESFNTSDPELMPLLLSGLFDDLFEQSGLLDRDELKRKILNDIAGDQPLSAFFRRNVN